MKELTSHLRRTDNFFKSGRALSPMYSVLNFPAPTILVIPSTCKLSLARMNRKSKSCYYLISETESIGHLCNFFSSNKALVILS